MKIVNMPQSCRGNFLTCFFVGSLQKSTGSHWFRKVLLELLSLSFFIKWWNSTKPFFFCMSKQYFCQTFFLKKNTLEIYLIYWNVLLWILPDCLAFDRNPTKFYVYRFLIFTKILLRQFSLGNILPTHFKENTDFPLQNPWQLSNAEVNFILNMTLAYLLK